MIAMTTSSSMRVKAVIRRAALICLIPPLPAVEFIPGFDPESLGLRVGNALLEAGRGSDVTSTAEKGKSIPAGENCRGTKGSAITKGYLRDQLKHCPGEIF